VSRLEQLVAAADASEESLQQALAPLMASARSAFQAAGDEAVEYVELVLANNPTADPADILRRADVRQATSLPFREARTRTSAAIRAAWSTGVARGRAAGNADLAILGIASYRDALLADVRTNSLNARARISNAVLSGGSLDAIPRDLGNRAAIGVNVSGHRAYNAAKLRAFEVAMAKKGVTVRKVWVTRFRPTTCRTCAALHGTVRNLSEPFPTTAHMGPGNPPNVYIDLNHPPRHPNCGCRVVPFIVGMSQEPGFSLTEMQSEAVSWLSDLLRAS
jgi:hypothetical protein